MIIGFTFTFCFVFYYFCRNYVNLILGIGVIEGIGRQLDPKLNILSVALPLFMQADMEIKTAFLKTSVTRITKQVSS